MDIKQLKYFLTVAEERQITGAAKRLHMAQPPLSQQLKSLETELGMKLVERDRHGIRLTDEGRLLHNRAEQILELMETTVKELKEMHDGYSGILSIGAVASSGSVFLPGRIRKFHEQYPDINFQFWEGDTFRILELLNTGVIEIGIVRSIFDSELFQSISLPDEPMVVAMGREGNCGEQPRQIMFAELAGKPLLLHRNHEMMIVEHCRKSGFEPRILCKGDDVRSVLAWADAGIGLAIVPKSTIALVPSNNLQYKEIIKPALEIQKSVIWRKNRYLSAAARHFLDTLGK